MYQYDNFLTIQLRTKIMNIYYQLRLDFDTFTITGPSTLTTSTVKTISGSVSTGDGLASTGASQCATDLFSVTNPGGSTTPPAICGTNTGEHSMVYFFSQLKTYPAMSQSVNNLFLQHYFQKFSFFHCLVKRQIC